MLKLLADSVFSFDVEWIPDPKSAEILTNLKENKSNVLRMKGNLILLKTVFGQFWQKKCMVTEMRIPKMAPVKKLTCSS